MTDPPATETVSKLNPSHSPQALAWGSEAREKAVTVLTVSANCAQDSEIRGCLLETVVNVSPLGHGRNPHAEAWGE